MNCLQYKGEEFQGPKEKPRKEKIELKEYGYHMRKAGLYKGLLGCLKRSTRAFEVLWHLKKVSELFAVEYVMYVLSNLSLDVVRRSLSL